MDWVPLCDDEMDDGSFILSTGQVQEMSWCSCEQLSRKGQLGGEDIPCMWVAPSYELGPVLNDRAKNEKVNQDPNLLTLFSYPPRYEQAASHSCSHKQNPFSLYASCLPYCNDYTLKLCANISPSPLSCFLSDIWPRQREKWVIEDLPLMVGFNLCTLSNNSWRQILLSERPPLCYFDHVEKELKRQELRYGTPQEPFSDNTH